MCVGRRRLPRGCRPAGLPKQSGANVAGAAARGRRFPVSKDRKSACAFAGRSGATGAVTRRLPGPGRAIKPGAGVPAAYRRTYMLSGPRTVRAELGQRRFRSSAQTAEPNSAAAFAHAATRSWRRLCRVNRQQHIGNRVNGRRHFIDHPAVNGRPPANGISDVQFAFGKRRHAALCLKPPDDLLRP